MNNLCSIFTYCWYLYVYYCQIFQAVFAVVCEAVYEINPVCSEVYVCMCTHASFQLTFFAAEVWFSSESWMVTNHTDRSIPSKLQLGFLHSDSINKKSTLKTSTEHRFSFLNRVVLWILDTDAFSTTSGQTTPCTGYHSVFVTPTKNIITCIMIKQSVI